MRRPSQPEEEIRDGWDFRVSLDDPLLEGLKIKTFEDFYTLMGKLHLETQTIRTCQLSAG